MATFPKLGVKAAGTMAKALIGLADRYPRIFLTEEDFYPAVAAYLADHFPPVIAEYAVNDGEVDFRIGSSNPTLLELAVQPRELQDVNNPSLNFPGHTARNKLYGSQNRTELQKLKDAPKGTLPILMLIDLTGKYDIPKLEATYTKLMGILPGSATVRVIYQSSVVRHEFTFS